MYEEQNYLNVVEKVYSQVSREYDNEERAVRSEGPSRRMLNQTNLTEIDDPTILYRLIEDFELNDINVRNFIIAFYH